MSFSAKAQTVSPDTLTGELGEIRVEATFSNITRADAPLSLSYLTRDEADMASNRAATLDELTFLMPGISVSNRENYALGERLTIRGMGWRAQFGVRGVQVLLDDMPLTVADGQTIMSMIDPAMVRQAELLRGPSALFWGNSSGGVIHLSTKPDINDPVIQYRGYGGSYQTFKQELRWNTTLRDARFYGYASWFSTDGFRDHSAAELFRMGAGTELNLTPDSRLRVQAAYTGMPNAEHPGSLTQTLATDSPQQARDLFVNTQTGKTFDQAMLTAVYTSGYQTGTLQVVANGTYRNLDNPILFRHIDLERYAGGFRSTYQFSELPVDIDIGTEFKIQSDDRLVTNNNNGSAGDEIQLNQLETVTNQALFIRSGVSLTRQLYLHAGVRTDWLQFDTDDRIGDEQEGKRNFTSVNPAIGISYNRSYTKTYLNVSSSFESPTTTELVNRPDGSRGFNPNVDPEKTIGIEGGMNGYFPKSAIRYDVALFAMRVRDILLPFELGDQQGVTFFRNEGTSRHLGFEAAAEVDINRYLGFQGSFTFLNAEFIDGPLDGNEIPGVPDFRFGGKLNLSLGSHQFNIENEWVGSYKADSENLNTNDSYSIVHIRWAAAFRSIVPNTTLRPFFSVSNLFNTRYNSSIAINNSVDRFFEPGSDRNFTAGLQVGF